MTSCGLAGPFITVLAVNPENKCGMYINCLLDTGARHSIFSKDVCDATDHNYEGFGVKQSSSAGIGTDELPTWLHTFEIHLLAPNSDEVVWKGAPVEIECGKLPTGIPNILGYDNFLKHFKMDVDYPRGVFTLHVP
jgi:hypothetical protein